MSDESKATAEWSRDGVAFRALRFGDIDELRAIRVALDHRNVLLEESNTLARERNKPPVIDVRVEVNTGPGDNGAQLIAEGIRDELRRVFNGTVEGGA